MTNAPSDLLAHRSVMADVTGLPNPSDIGIVGDGAHQRTGGYHEGKDVLLANGVYHPPATANVGSLNEDYSVRLLRDRTGLTNSASAVDYGDNWPHGGRAAWIRFNNLLVAALHANDARLSAIRAVNYTPDGTAKKRTDRQAGWTVVNSTDSVDIHTHVEYYRDTEGNRQQTLDTVAAIARAAIANQPTPPPEDTVTGTPATIMQDDHTGQKYLCAGGFSFLIDPAKEANIRAFAAEGVWQLNTKTANTPYWVDNGGTRTGWEAATCGPVWTGVAPASITDAQVTALAQQLAPLISAGATVDQVKDIINGTSLKTG